MIDNVCTNLLESLGKEKIQKRLLATSIILSSYEIIKSMIIERTKLLFLVGFGFDGDKYSSEYKTEVLSLHQYPLIASAKYLVEHYNAIDNSDLEKIIKLRDMRNDIAHKLHNVITKYTAKELNKFVKNSRDITFKLDNFWTYIEIGADPKFIEFDFNLAHSNETTFIDILIEAVDIYENKST